MIQKIPAEDLQDYLAASGDQLLKLSAAAELIGFTYDAILKWVRAEDLPSYQVKGRYRVLRSQVFKLVDPV